MNTGEAKTLLQEKLAEYRSYRYDSLLRLLSEQDVFEIVGPSGAVYQVEVHAVWDDVRKGDIRVIGTIDDGRWRAFFPVTSDFAMRADGTFVGES
jgi:hypothetical protein